RQYLGDDVDVDRGEKGRLLVAALVVLAEGVVDVRTQGRIAREGTRHRADCGQTVDAARRRARRGSQQVGGTALRNAEVVEVHVVVNDELLPEHTEEPADAALGVRADAQLVTRVSVIDDVLPLAGRRIALQRM